MSSKPHEYASGLLWFLREGAQISLGVTDAGLQDLGTVESIDFSEPGDEFVEGDWVAEVSGANSTMEVSAPVAFVVDEVNEELLENPQHLVDDPTGDGWIIRGTVREV